MSNERRVTEPRELLDLQSLRPLFEPRSVAIIGASADPARIGGRPLAGCSALGFLGALYPVNPVRDRIQGLPAYPTIGAIGAPIDLAIIALPAEACVDALRQCAHAGVKAAVVLSAGFAEGDTIGRERQSQMAAIARDAGMRLVGPNCMGLVNLKTGLVASFTSLVDGDPSRRGAISVVSQSGAFGSHCLALMRERGLGLDLWATTGNQADVDFAECLAWLAQSPQTKVIAGCVEGIVDGPRFLAALELARERGIPVVLMKLGRSDVGREAAATHTAALTGSDAVLDAVLRDYAVHRAYTVDELFDVAYACTMGKFPATRDVGLLTTSGGFGIVMADAAADHGLCVPALPAATQARLKALVPFASPRNPLDVTGQFINDPSSVLPMFEALIADGGFPATICYIGSAGSIPHLIDSLAAAFEAVAQRHPAHLLVLSMIAPHAVRQRFERLGYLVFEDPSRALAAVAALHRLGIALGSRRSDGVKDATTMKAIDAPGLRGATLDEALSRQVLRAAGVPFTDSIVARSAQQAAAAATKLSFPVALKILSKDIPHKSDAGGVMLDIGSETAAREAYERLVASARGAMPSASADGVLVAPMVDNGIEVIVGCIIDPLFGPIVMVGLGGVFVEAIGGMQARRAPFAIATAQAMIAELKGVAILHGLRGRPPADIDALARLLVDLSAFAVANRDWLQSVDLNPVAVLARGHGIVALDALVAINT